ncbi:MAG TPA: CBS domain-containing protein [Patescibacteria group bacterium]|nr:CBS domain-containing protein [Patescibacteria group bacterium]
MKIKDIMTVSVITVSPQTSITSLFDIISQYGFHGLPVIENKKVVGIVTEDDFFLKNYDDLYLPAYIRFVKENKNAGNISPDIKEKIEKILTAKTKDLMSENPITASPEMEVMELMDTIKKTKFVTFPVTDNDKKLLGIVTLADILGTVKSETLKMKKAMRNEKKIEGLAKELDSLWKEDLVLVSRKKVKTWKALTLISIFMIAGALILIGFKSKTATICENDQTDFYPITCQFDYSQWSACQTDGIQTRNIIKKSPENCEGGTVELSRSCQ